MLLPGLNCDLDVDYAERGMSHELCRNSGEDQTGGRDPDRREQRLKQMMEAMGNGTSIPEEMIPRCPNCGAEAFPWVRGYGNFLQGRKYDEQYQKISKYITEHRDKKILFLELGVGRLTPMFIQEPFWNLTLNFENAFYIAVNDQYDFLPEQIEEKGFVIRADIGRTLEDAAAEMKGGMQV